MKFIKNNYRLILTDWCRKNIAIVAPIKYTCGDTGEEFENVFLSVEIIIYHSGA